MLLSHARHFTDQVSDFVRSRYEDLRPHGPNDGLTLLTDEMLPNGIAVSELGLDHYFKDPEIDVRSLALGAFVAEELAKRSLPILSARK